MPDFHNYDPLNIQMSWNGIIFTGLAPDTYISIEMNTDLYTMQVGSDGSVCRIKSNDLTAIATLTLTQSSPTNSLLAAKHVLDRRYGNPQIGPFSLKDDNGDTLCFAENAWIQKSPVVSFGNSAETREWMFGCAEMLIFVGGNLS